MEQALCPEADFKASRIISTCPFFSSIQGSPNYGKVYYQTNEDLKFPYYNIDFYEKDVLSVLSSGDHVFTARFLEAQRVDAFDINTLTIYYFYLRLWSIKYKQELFPNILTDDYSWLESLLEEVKTNSHLERIILSFYKKHLEARTNFKYFFFEPDSQVKGRTTYTDVSELVNYVDGDFTFYNIDLFKKVSIEKDYDIVLTSNILEWAQTKQKREQAAENLAALTRKDGMVICSKLFSITNLEEEKEIFAPYFEQENRGKTYIYYRK